ncbi:class I SAM-dependent methyltransferase [Persicimonas caeni]|uniref:Class I SAM-dependent methyltransferase n=1 Tax=Persicimonas caeni TaxID=2292766 RepID=A0A4Y6PSQ6_PERCE|nr:class I SAM-dependent methyltransferase [Persicimonas caeni]QDG51149.1 class I SAM-dependent methyltransferase [Persicimonas caeni]QED32370.1 class I SAM-dependent methyltransferase [Persicimonas caeni]
MKFESRKDVQALDYPDFVALLGQENTPPGGEDTVRWWIDKASIDEHSHLLDLACSTGFSSRYIAHHLGCSGVGIDLSSSAIERARQVRGELRLDFQVADATDLPLADETFTHVVAGGTFAFFDASEAALDEVARVLEPGGKLCVSNFFYRSSPPDELLDTVEQYIDFRPRAHWTEQWWREYFTSRFELCESQTHSLEPVSIPAVVFATRRMLDESSFYADARPELQQQCFDRMRDTRIVLNEHRRYQGLALEIWELK